MTGELEVDEDDRGRRNTARLALATGAVAIGSIGSIATYFAVHGPLGSLNDVGNASLGILGGALVWRIRREAGRQASPLAVATAASGAAVTVVGSGLVISGTTGWFLAGLVSSLGFAGVGAGLLGVAMGAQAAPWPRSLRRTAAVAGALMTLGGLVAVPAIALGVDDPATAPGWAWLGFVGWLGTYVAFPAWAIRFGLREARDSEAPRPLQAATGRAG